MLNVMDDQVVSPQSNQQNINPAGQPEPPLQTPKPLVTSGPKKSILKPLMVIVLILAVAAGAAYGAYRWESNRAAKVEASKQAQLDSLQKLYTDLQAKAKTSQVTTTTTPTSTSSTSTQKYLVIKELGIKIPLQTGLTDLEYSYVAPTSTYPHKVLYFGSKSLETADSSCKLTSTYGPLGGDVLALTALSKNPGTTDSQDGTLLASNVNGYYLYYKSSQVVCTNKSTAKTLLAKQTAILQAELKNTVAQ